MEFRFVFEDRGGKTYTPTCSDCGAGTVVHEHNNKLSILCLVCSTSVPVIMLDEVQASADDKVEVLVDGSNAQTADWKSVNTVKTLDDLVKKYNIDLDAWKVDHYISNVWHQASKVKDTGDVRITPLYQIKAWLIRLVPIEQEWPVIAPAQIKITPQKKAISSRKKTIFTKLIIPDSQNGYRRDMDTGYLDPFHDRRAWDLCLQLAEATQPDSVIFLGDMIDLPDWSDKFLRSPDLKGSMQPAIDELAWWIGQFRHVLPNAEMDYAEGNHEDRAFRAVVTNLEQAYNIKPANRPSNNPLLSIPFLLGLEDLGVKYHGPYPRSRVWINNNLVAEHGDTVRAKSGQSVGNIVQDARTSRVCGHIHRYELASKTVFGHKGGVTYTAFSPGTIARIDGAVPARSAENN